MDEVAENDGPMNGTAGEPTPAAPLGHNAGPPPSVHNRFHPVPTRPVFSNPAPQRNTTIEALPHEYGSTPRLRSVPRPQLDPDELKEEKQKAEWWGRDELQQIPGHTVAP